MKLNYKPGSEYQVSSVTSSLTQCLCDLCINNLEGIMYLVVFDVYYVNISAEFFKALYLVIFGTQESSVTWLGQFPWPLHKLCTLYNLVLFHDGVVVSGVERKKLLAVQGQFRQIGYLYKFILLYTWNHFFFTTFIENTLFETCSF